MARSLDSERLTVPEFALGSAVLEDAFRFAADAHQGRRRQDDASEIGHPTAVAALLRDAGFGDEVVAAALLHDVIEDTATEPEEIESRFGPRIEALVDAMTEDAEISSYEDRKAEHRERVVDAGPDVAAIYAADKLAKLRQRSDADELPPAKLAHYAESHRVIRNRYPEIPFLDDLEAELDRIRAAPGGPGMP